MAQTNRPWLKPLIFEGVSLFIALLAGLAIFLCCLYIPGFLPLAFLGGIPHMAGVAALTGWAAAGIVAGAVFVFENIVAGLVLGVRQLFLAFKGPHSIPVPAPEPEPEPKPETNLSKFVQTPKLKELVEGEISELPVYVVMYARWRENLVSSPWSGKDLFLVFDEDKVLLGTVMLSRSKGDMIISRPADPPTTSHNYSPCEAYNYDNLTQRSYCASFEGKLNVDGDILESDTHAELLPRISQECVHTLELQSDSIDTVQAITKCMTEKLTRIEVVIDSKNYLNCVAVHLKAPKDGSDGQPWHGTLRADMLKAQELLKDYASKNNDRLGRIDSPDGAYKEVYYRSETHQVELVAEEDMRREVVILKHNEPTKGLCYYVVALRPTADDARILAVFKPEHESLSTDVGSVSVPQAILEEAKSVTHFSGSLAMMADGQLYQYKTKGFSPFVSLESLERIDLKAFAQAHTLEEAASAAIYGSPIGGRSTGPVDPPEPNTSEQPRSQPSQ